MTIYDGYRNQRWHCHACGAGGTAIDLYATATGTQIGHAIRALAQRAGLDGGHSAAPLPTSRRRPVAAIARVASTTPDPAIELYVAAAAALLRSPQGQAAREYLRNRGLADRELLRINRVGYDPGPRALPRAPGLPRRGGGIVLPILDATGRAVFCTTRYFDQHSAGRRYDNAASNLAVNPKIATIRPVEDTHPKTVVVTEGIIDALTAARHGYTAAAVLGAASAGRGVSDWLSSTHGNRRLLIAFDGDAAGRAAALRLGGTLTAGGRTIVVGLVRGDLNDQVPTGLAELLSSADCRNVDNRPGKAGVHNEHSRPSAERTPEASAPTFGL
jgi:Toprim-like